LGIRGTGFYRLDVLPVTQTTVSKFDRNKQTKTEKINKVIVRGNKSRRSA